MILVCVITDVIVRYFQTTYLLIDLLKLVDFTNLNLYIGWYDIVLLGLNNRVISFTRRYLGQMIYKYKVKPIKNLFSQIT